MAESRFKRIAGAKAQRAGSFAKFGDYLLEVQALQLFKGHKGDTFVAELKVLESKKTEATDPDPVGKVVSYVEICEGQWGESAAGRALAFLQDLTGDGEITDADIEQSTGKDQPLKFMQIRGQAFPKTTKKGGTITAWRWENVPATDALLADIKKRRDAEAKAAA